MPSARIGRWSARHLSRGSLAREVLASANHLESRNALDSLKLLETVRSQLTKDPQDELQLLLQWIDRSYGYLGYALHSLQLHLSELLVMGHRPGIGLLMDTYTNRVLTALDISAAEQKEQQLVQQEEHEKQQEAQLHAAEEEKKRRQKEENQRKLARLFELKQLKLKNEEREAAEREAQRKREQEAEQRAKAAAARGPNLGDSDSDIEDMNQRPGAEEEEEEQEEKALDPWM